MAFLPKNSVMASSGMSPGFQERKGGLDVSEGDVSEGDVSEGDVSEGDVSDGDVSGGDVSEGDVSEADGSVRGVSADAAIQLR
jgi:hypothetical protein